MLALTVQVRDMSHMLALTVQVRDMSHMLALTVHVGDMSHMLALTVQVRDMSHMLALTVQVIITLCSHFIKSHIKMFHIKSADLRQDYILPHVPIYVCYELL
jgi:hypothetical protein